jgi:hypothetical protein
MPTVCSASEYTAVEYTITSDRECANLTVCSDTEFETIAATRNSDRSCAATRTCSDGEWQTAAPTTTTDRTCANLTICDADGGEYELIASSVTTDRICGLPNLVFPTDFDTLFPADERETLLSLFEATLVSTLALLVKDRNPPALFSVYEGSVLVTIQYDDNFTDAALAAVAANCGIRFTFNGVDLSPSPIASPGSCDITTTQEPINIGLGDASLATGSDSSDDNSNSSATAAASALGALALVALVALVTITGKRRNQDTKGSPIRKDAVDAAGLNPLYAGQAGSFAHNDRGAAKMIAGQEQVYSNPSEMAPKPGDPAYEAYYDTMQKQDGVEIQNAMYQSAASQRRPSGQLESGYTYGVGGSAEQMYDVGSANDEHLVGVTAPQNEYTIGSDYASKNEVDATYDIGAAQPLYDGAPAPDAVGEPTYDIGDGDGGAVAEPTYDIGAAGGPEATYGIAAGTLTAENPLDYEAIGGPKPTAAATELIYDNHPNSPEAPPQDEIYGLGSADRTASYNDAHNAPVANIDAVYDQ